MSNTGWSNDRVTTLSRLWLDGLSASEIAKALGGVTRNAVIGKVHRLGLSGREIRSALTTRVSTAKAPREPRQPRAARTPPPALVCAPVPIEVPEGPGLAASLVHLGAHACKWPIGDPQSPNFSFCGGSATGRYCDAHERAGTRPGQTRPRLDRDPVVRRALAGLI